MPMGRRFNRNVAAAWRWRCRSLIDVHTQWLRPERELESRSVSLPQSPPTEPQGARTAMSATKSLEDLFVNLLKDMYYAEKQILKALPKMAKKADSNELRQAFEHHLEETQGQVERLEEAFGLCGIKPAGKTCPAIKGILEEGEEGMKDAKDPDVLD